MPGGFFFVRQIPNENDSHLAAPIYNTHSRTHVPRGTSLSRKKSRNPLISLKFWRGGASAKAKWNYDGVARAIVPNRAGFVKSFFDIR